MTHEAKVVLPQSVLVVHGGTTFSTYDGYHRFLVERELTLDRLRPRASWKQFLPAALGSQFDVLTPNMPNPTNAVYEEWALWCSRILSLLTGPVHLVGHSLGGVFLAKYLATSTPRSCSIRGLYLVAAPFCEDGTDEELASFALPETLTNVSKQCENIFLYQSRDDPVVPVEQVTRYHEALPGAQMRIVENQGHFLGESFPELIADMRRVA